MAKSKFPKKNPEVTDPIAPTAPNTVSPPIETATAAEPRKTEVRKTARKPEIVKAETRSKLIPINMEDEIRRLAYLLSERRGFEPGHETEDWLSAEREVLQRYHHQQTA